MKPWTPPKRPGEMQDTARISKEAKVRPEDVKVRAGVRNTEIQALNMLELDNRRNTVAGGADKKEFEAKLENLMREKERAFKKSKEEAR